MPGGCSAHVKQNQSEQSAAVLNGGEQPQPLLGPGEDNRPAGVVGPEEAISSPPEAIQGPIP